MTGPARAILLGGGFSTEADSPLDDFVLDTAGVERPRVCFLPTASGDAEGYVERFHAAFADRACVPSHLALFRRTDLDPRAHLLAQDVVYVGGGNTANMLAVWRLHGVDRVLVEAYRAGVLLCGISAGAACWLASCLTDSFGPLAPLGDGLGLLPGSLCPHYDSEPGRRPGYRAAVAGGELPAGWALDDSAAALFTDGRLTDVVATSPGATLHRVERGPDGSVVETAQPARLLVAGH